MPGVLTGTPMGPEQLAAAVVAASGQAHLESVLLSGWARCSSRWRPGGSSRSVRRRADRDVRGAVDLAWGSGNRSIPSRPWPSSFQPYWPRTSRCGLNELHRWSAARPAGAAAGGGGAGDELVDLDVESARGWVAVAGAAAVAPAEPSRVVRLPPGFDPSSFPHLSHRLAR